MAHVSCSSDDDNGVVDEAGTHMIISEYEQGAIQNVNKFSIKFYQKFCESKEVENVDNFIVSPVSAAMSMTMLANACEGKSQEEILNAFGYSAGEISELNSIVGRLCKELPNVASSLSTLNFANSIWINNSFKCSQGYIDDMLNLFNAKIGVAEIRTESGEINDWISQATNGAIENMYKSGGSESVLMINSLYFEAPWNKAFDKGKTSKKEFHNIDGTASKVDMMRGEQDVYYYEDSDLKAISIYYSKSALSYTIIMPQKAENFSDIVPSLDADKLAYIFEQRSRATATVVMPKVNIQSDVDLNEAYQKMGIITAYNPENYDFAPIGASKLCVTAAKQKSSLNVSEEKTVVASTTYSSVGMYTANLVKDLGEVVIDRPYIFIINGISGNYGLIAMGQVSKL
jgi:serpin B